MSVAAFEPKFMKVGVLTAALQELTPREKRDPDPDLAVEEWAAFAREVGADYIQLSAALHPNEADIPPEAMLDPVANTLDLREPFSPERAKRVQAALDANRVGISDVGYFDDMLHEDPKTRKKKHDFMLRAFDAAGLLQVDAICGFVGRNQSLSMEENLRDFEEIMEETRRAQTEKVKFMVMRGIETRLLFVETDWDVSKVLAEQEIR